MAKPNFFIVGGPKCGTTAMASFLQSHPDIYISEPKEPNFFADDMPKMKFVDSMNDYLALYRKKSKYKIICDASIFYMFSKIAIENIYKFNPDAKLLVMIRNPLEMVPSFHRQILFTLDEDQERFYDALVLEKDRVNNQNVPKHCRSKKLLEYSNIAKYGEQLNNIFEFFPRKNVKIILFDEFAKDNKLSYKEVLRFLDVPDDNKEDFPRVNDAKKAKSKIINRIVNRPPRFAKVIARFVRKLLKKPRLNILRKIDHLNRDKLIKTPISNVEIEMLVDIYQKDISLTEKLLKKDLSHWLNNETK